MQYNTIQHNTIRYNTIQYNTIQYNTIQYKTIFQKHLNYLREQKIKVLVQSVSNALNAVLQEAPSAGGSAGDALAMVSTQLRDVCAFLMVL